MCNHDHNEATSQAVDPEIKAIHERRTVIQALAAGGALTLTGASLSSCATNPETGEKQFIGFASESQLNSMALSSWNEMRQTLPTSNDPRYTSRLKNIGSRISRGANRSDQPWDYEVFADDQKNAFVLPGNRVGFYKGMMDFADNDDQIAAVMGHEVGHVAGRHARERVSQQMAGQLYTETASRNACLQRASANTQRLNQAMGLGFMLGVILPYSRKHELQSDLLGAKYMHKSGYDTRQAVRLWEKMAESQTSRTPEFMSTHPDPARRAQKLHDYITLQESLGSQGWENIKL